MKGCLKQHRQERRQVENKPGYRKKVPSLLGVLVLIFGVAAGVALIGRQQLFRLGASGDVEPRDVRISNITDSSFTVSWITEKDAVGLISWGTTTALGQLARQPDGTPKKIHSITLRGLTPSTNYFFVVNSGGVEFDNDSVPWSIQTAPTTAAIGTTLLASGTILNQNGQPAPNVLVYINGGAISQLSAITSINGTWTIPLSSARTKALTSLASIDPESSILDVFVQGGALGVATAQVLASNVDPIPNITLGQTYDFRNSTENGLELPEASVNLPEGDTSEEPTGPGGFDVSGEAPEDGASVTLESIEEPGEVIFVSNPEFFGQGPEGATLTITVESDPITGTAMVNSSGEWRWSPPEDLPEGTHKITIKWLDAGGVLRSLTRTFVVQAAEGDLGFESTPSGSTSTPTPTSSPSPTPSPTPTPTLKPTVTPTTSPIPTPTRISIPSTESGIPTAGSLTPTLILATIGLGLFISGIVISRRNTL